MTRPYTREDVQAWTELRWERERLGEQVMARILATVEALEHEEALHEDLKRWQWRVVAKEAKKLTQLADALEEEELEHTKRSLDEAKKRNLASAYELQELRLVYEKECAGLFLTTQELDTATKFLTRAHDALARKDAHGKDIKAIGSCLMDSIVSMQCSAAETQAEHAAEVNSVRHELGLVIEGLRSNLAEALKNKDSAQAELEKLRKPGDFDGALKELERKEIWRAAFNAAWADAIRAGCPPSAATEVAGRVAAEACRSKP